MTSASTPTGGSWSRCRRTPLGLRPAMRFSRVIPMCRALSCWGWGNPRPNWPRPSGWRRTIRWSRALPWAAPFMAIWAAHGWRARLMMPPQSLPWPTISPPCHRLGRGTRRSRSIRMTTIRLTAAQAMVRWLSVQMTDEGDRFIEGIWAIFGHGNVAGIGEALHAHRDVFPTWRGHNEQTMAHTAIAYAKASKRRRAMAVTTSIGPGALNVVTAAALAHVNRLPVLIIPGDVFANRAPDPVLQQIEDWGDGTVSANDAFKPVSRYFDRITRPEQILTALPRALRVMTDPAECGPVTLAFCQDVQAEAYDYPESFFTPKVWKIRRPEADADELAAAIALIKSAKAPVIVAGGGVIYSQAEADLAACATAHNIPVVETQGGKSALDFDHALNFGPVGVTGAASANTVC